MTIKAPLGQHCPLPMKLRTKFIASGMFSIAAATSACTLDFVMNTCVLPFATTNTSGAVTWYNLTIGTYYPAGFHQLCTANLYQQFVVESVLFEFDFTPQSVQDSVIVAGTPAQTGGVPSSVAAAMTRPWTKQMTFASGRTYRMGDYPYRHRINIPQYLGIPPFLMDNDFTTTFNGEPTASPTITLPYVVNVSTGDVVGLTVALECRVRVTYFTLLKNLNTDTMITS